MPVSTGGLDPASSVDSMTERDSSSENKRVNQETIYIRVNFMWDFHKFESSIQIFPLFTISWICSFLRWSNKQLSSSHSYSCCWKLQCEAFHYNLIMYVNVVLTRAWKYRILHFLPSFKFTNFKCYQFIPIWTAIRAVASGEVWGVSHPPLNNWSLSANCW